MLPRQCPCLEQRQPQPSCPPDGHPVEKAPSSARIMLPGQWYPRMRIRHPQKSSARGCGANGMEELGNPSGAGLKQESCWVLPVTLPGLTGAPRPLHPLPVLPLPPQGSPCRTRALSHWDDKHLKFHQVPRSCKPRAGWSRDPQDTNPARAFHVINIYL